MDFLPSVFLSFRREDTGRTFVSHLYRSLEKKRIRTYKDENQQAEDGRISFEVAKAIRESNVAVVVISENYASSVWCLDALATIIEHSGYNTPLITVFYEVDPGDLIRATGKFADDIRSHGERETPEIVNRWRNALVQLESTDRRFCSRNWEDDSKMLDDLIIRISTSRPARLSLPRRRSGQAQSSSATGPESKDLRLMSDTYMKNIPKSLSGFEETGLEIYAHQDTSSPDNMSNDPASDDSSNGLIGMNRHKKAVHRLLDLESKDTVRIIGIWGTEGVGKTTLAECVFDDISPHFQHYCFLTNINKIYHKRISPSLLKHLTRTKSSNDIFAAIKTSLVNRNVLLVVDGVDDVHNEQFKDAMKVTRWLGPGSRVIMTSDREHLLETLGVKHLYEMECPRYDEALQLFSFFAFKRTCPLIGSEGLSIRAVHFAGRLPLALKVLGSFLHDKDEEFWKNTLQKLEALQDNDSRLISNYIGASKYLPRPQIELEQYVVADEEEEHSSSYHMLL